MFYVEQVLAATQTPGESGMNWFMGTADAVRQFTWLFEVILAAKSRNEHLSACVCVSPCSRKFLFYSFIITSEVQ